MLKGQEALTAIVLLLLETWRAARMQAARLDRQLMASAGERGLAADNDGSGDRRCHCPVLHKRDRVASNVDSSRAVGAYVGLKARSYQSGEIDHGNQISKRGDKNVCSLLYEAATVVPKCSQDLPFIGPRGSRIFGMGPWFWDPVVAAASLDRLLHHAAVIQIDGANYRLREHADLVPEKNPAEKSHPAVADPANSQTSWPAAQKRSS